MDRFFDNYVMTPMQTLVGDRIRTPAERDPQGAADARKMLDTAYGWLEGAIRPPFRKLFPAGAPDRD